MPQHTQLTAALLARYRAVYGDGHGCPDWAVRKRNSPSQAVLPTIPFVGKRYAAQAPRILVYASAENLADYWRGNDRHWVGDWLDDDARACDRHRYCFENPDMQRGRALPYVHCSPLEKGGLLTAIMYLAARLTPLTVDHPRDFYETIAFGNYGKFSIETAFQRAVRQAPQLTDAERRQLKATLPRRNIDYVAARQYLQASHPYLRADLEVLRPDIIIMPHVDDHAFLDELCGQTRIIRIYQMNSTVINNLAPNRRNGGCSRYARTDPDRLPPPVRATFEAMRGINHENYLYVFDYLDHVLADRDAEK